jgi:hypothetical protein
MPRKRSSSAAEPKTPESKKRKSAPVEIPDETRAHDLVAEAPAPPPPPRKVGPRRVVGYETCERLLRRRAFRPAGNSRRFWSRVEEDDPFLVPRRDAPAADELAALSPGASRELAASERLSRVEPARGEGRAKTPPRPAREPSHLPETRTAPPPKVQAPAPKPAPKPAPAPRPVAREPEAPPAVDRRPPRIVNQPPAAPAAPTPPPATVQRRLVSKDGRSATEVRAEAERARAAVAGPKPPPPRRGIDDVLSILGQLRLSEQAFREGRVDEATELAPVMEKPKSAPRPVPKAVAPAPRPPPPPPEDEWEPEPPPPPRPAPKSAPAPLNRSPKAAAQGSSGGTLDDVFGGPQEGRVKVGRRTVRPTSTGSSDPE